jgi:hypothetical protein
MINGMRQRFGSYGSARGPFEQIEHPRSSLRRDPTGLGPALRQLPAAALLRPVPAPPTSDE